MKVVAFWLAVLGFAAVAAVGCSVDHRSGDFACAKQSDCAAGRTCSDGLCVAPPLDSGVTTDAQPTGDANSCPSQCTSCAAGTKTCTIDCALNNGACSQAITCPAGWSCNIMCSRASSCRNGINCLGSKSCTITCSGSLSCRNISCGGGPCNVDCSGSGSCRDVSCGLSCACDVTCQATSLCANLTCKAPQCVSPSTFGGCTSLGNTCNTCP